MYLHYFYKGNKDLLNKTKIAIVGSRKINDTNKKILIEFLNKIFPLNITTISGGAFGTDVIVHEHTLDKTVCVLPCDIENITPKQNKPIISRIPLLISHYNTFIKVKPSDYLNRNKTICELSDFMVVVQAETISGTMSSVRHMLRLKKPIYTFKSNIDIPPLSKLIKENKIKVIEDFDNFINEIKDIYNIK